MPALFRYRQLANVFAQQITQGLLRPGDRLPSVRQVSREQQVSLTTVFQAYYLLEADGLIQARPQSGYYVQAARTPPGLLPTPSRPAMALHDVSVTQTLLGLAQSWNRPGLIDLAVAVPSLALLPQAALTKSLLAAVRALPDSGLSYPAMTGNASLRRQIAQRASQWGNAISADEVIVTNGCMEALVLAVKAVTKPHDVVAVESPTYHGILRALEGMGLRVYELPTDTSTGPELPALEQALQTTSIKAVVLTTTFSNPTGACMPAEHKQALVELLARHEIPLIEDDVYGDLHFSGVRPVTCKAFDRQGLVMLCSSLSKTLAPGYRVGWVLAGRFHAAVLAQKMMHSGRSGALNQAAAADFLSSGRYAKSLPRLRAALRQQVAAYREVVRAHFPAGTRVSNPQGGLVLWVELPPAYSAMELLRQAADAGIIFYPGTVFTTQELYGNCLRLACGQPLEPQIAQALQALGKLVMGQAKGDLPAKSKVDTARLN
ncbi:aminotransferase-like domain-containing protein [Hymenobacter terrenus]|uniref:aminotransferase-like domain-containing protein n=1 Tax=Hymenobacter terrenus TaxID=1629124 RepID=UPI000697943D|nr:PLP-dependent aminotransferase family protein [Hymenobacter terrenus]